MKKMVVIMALVLGLTMISKSYAQLPANPWKPAPPVPNEGYFGDNVPEQGPATAPSAPVYSNNSSGGEVLPVDPWARARDKTNTQTWRQSGNHGRLNYVGEATTWGDAYGQEMILPEVNRHNMLTATDHLRNLGYKIPASYDNKIKNMPRAYRNLLEKNYNNLPSNNDPLSQSFHRVMTTVEDGTGLDFENILFNTMDLIGTD